MLRRNMHGQDLLAADILAVPRYADFRCTQQLS
jgi:hypothetical protein